MARFEVIDGEVVRTTETTEAVERRDLEARVSQLQAKIARYQATLAEAEADLAAYDAVEATIPRR